MVANTFAADLKISGSVSLTDAGLLLWSPVGQVDIGGLFQAIGVTLDDGTGDLQAQQLYAAQQTINAASTFTLDLNGALLNFRGQSIAMTKLKGVLVALVDPDGIKKFTIGPDGGATPLQAWFNATTAGQKTTHFHFCFESHQWGGWTVVGGASDCLYIANPGGSAIAVNILAWGI